MQIVSSGHSTCHIDDESGGSVAPMADFSIADFQLAAPVIDDRHWLRLGDGTVIFVSVDFRT